MRRQYWLFLCLVLLLVLIQITKNPYLSEGSGGGVALIMESEWLERLFMLCLILFVINVFLSVELRLNKNPQADDRRFLLSTVLSLFAFFSMLGLFYIIIKNRKDALKEILQLVNPGPPQATPASLPTPTVVAEVNTVLVGLLLLVLCLIFISFIVRKARKRWDDAPSAAQKKETGAPLETFDDPRLMIIAYYRHACHLLALKGFAGQEHQTPRQFEEVVGTPYRKPLSSLTPLFEEAKYSHHTQTEEKKRKACRYYEEIRGEGDVG